MYVLLQILLVFITPLLSAQMIAPIAGKISNATPTRPYRLVQISHSNGRRMGKLTYEPGQSHRP